MSLRIRPITLCYHALSANWKTALAVSPLQFADLLQRFAERGYVGLTFAEAERRRRDQTLPRRTLVVTFDDAFLSILEARPILAELGFVATVFVVSEFVAGDRLLEWDGITDWLETEHREELRCLDEDQLRSLQDGGWEIASHTMTHPLLTALDSETCLRELTSSRDVLREILGSCETIAYPYGHADARVAELAARAGYIAGCTLTRSLRRDEPLLRPRVSPSGSDDPLRARLKISRPGLWVRRVLPMSIVERL